MCDRKSVRISVFSPYTKAVRMTLLAIRKADYSLLYDSSHSFLAQKGEYSIPLYH